MLSPWMQQLDDDDDVGLPKKDLQSFSAPKLKPVGCEGCGVKLLCESYKFN